MYFFSFRFIPSYTINKLREEREGGNVPVPVFGPSKCRGYTARHASVSGGRVLARINLRFQLEVESSAAETELVLVVLRMLNS